jgi:hypothetical protein
MVDADFAPVCAAVCAAVDGGRVGIGVGLGDVAAVRAVPDAARHALIATELRSCASSTRGPSYA